VLRYLPSLGPLLKNAMGEFFKLTFNNFILGAKASAKILQFCINAVLWVVKTTWTTSTSAATFVWQEFVKILPQMLSKEILAKLREIGEELKTSFDKYARTTTVAWSVIGVGSVTAIALSISSFVRDSKTHTYLHPLLSKLYEILPTGVANALLLTGTAFEAMFIDKSNRFNIPEYPNLSAAASVSTVSLHTFAPLVFWTSLEAVSESGMFDATKGDQIMSRALKLATKWLIDKKLPITVLYEVVRNIKAISGTTSIFSDGGKAAMATLANLTALYALNKIVKEIRHNNLGIDREHKHILNMISSEPSGEDKERALALYKEEYALGKPRNFRNLKYAYYTAEMNAKLDKRKRSLAWWFVHPESIPSTE